MTTKLTNLGQYVKSKRRYLIPTLGLLLACGFIGSTAYFYFNPIVADAENAGKVLTNATVTESATDDSVEESKSDNADDQNNATSPEQESETDDASSNNTVTSDQGSNPYTISTQTTTNTDSLSSRAAATNQSNANNTQASSSPETSQPVHVHNWRVEYQNQIVEPAVTEAYDLCWCGQEDPDSEHLYQHFLRKESTATTIGIRVVKDAVWAEKPSYRICDACEAFENIF